MIKKITLLTLLLCISISISSQTLINSENFEGGSFIGTEWNDGGTNCELSASAPPNSNYAVKLTSGSADVNYTVYTNVFDLTAYAAVEITFDFETSGYSGDNDFYLEYTTNGSTWIKVPDDGFNIDDPLQFADGIKYLAQKVTINDVFSTTTRFRFRSSANGDVANILYIDNIEIVGYANLETFEGLVLQADSGDDAEERHDGLVDLTSSDLEFCTDVDDSGNNQLVGVRFQNVTVPKGATITNAYIQFVVDAETSSGPVTIKIVGIDVDNSQLFTTSTSNISQRINGTISSETTESAIWTPINDWNSTGAKSLDQRTSDISLIVKEIVDRGGWSSGNSMSFVFSHQSGSPNRRIAADGDATGDEPILHIEYIPTTEIDVLGNNVSITNGDNTPSTTDNTDFGNVGNGFYKDVTFTIKNEGGLDLDLDGSPIVDFVSGSDSEFQIITQPSAASIGADESLDFVVRFTPSGIASYTATISIDNNDSDEDPFTFDISGEGVTPVVEIDITDSSLNAIDDGGANSPSLANNTDFGATYAGAPIIITYIIENNGSANITGISASSDNSDFVISTLPNTTVLVGESTTFKVTFTPSTITNDISGIITVLSNDPDESPYTFNVQGDGVDTPTFPSEINFRDEWTYLDNGTDPGSTWKNLSFDDSSWKTGDGQFGYGDNTVNDGANTIIDFGLDSSNKYITTFFRKKLTILNTSLFNSIDLKAIRDDGMIVYINGTEVWRDNLDTSPTYTQNSIASIDYESARIETKIANSLVSGENIIAVEIHQSGGGTADMSFDLDLKPNARATGLPLLNRGPYLQSGTSSSVVVRWRTDSATESTVYYGTTLGSVTTPVTVSGTRTDHEVTISGLSANTKYYYTIADSHGLHLKESEGKHFITSPTIGTKQFVRAWVLGDAGTSSYQNNSYTGQQREVMNRYYEYVESASTNPGKTDMMLFLGDNAYDKGTDTEFQDSFFTVYDEMLKKAVAWSCLGNHETYGPGTAQESPYYDMFTFPEAGEAGGDASGTEQYYSFDYGNIHFIVLESMTLYNDTAQETWLTNDMQNTSQDWIVAFFHHPPYTKGSHNSDTETELVAMRQNFLPILEANGVDLVLNGHSHSYERSYFIYGHYDLSTNFDSSIHNNSYTDGNLIGLNGGGDGKEGSNGAYTRTESGIDNESTKGAVYITTGSAGKISGGSLNHAAMKTSLNKLGSCVIEIYDDGLGLGGQKLTLKFLRETGVVDDEFTIHKPSTQMTTLSTETYEEVDNKQIKIFPVPAKNLLNIDITNNENLNKVSFYSAIGALVKETEKQTINVSMLKTGMYMVVIETDQNRYYKSIIIE